MKPLSKVNARCSRSVRAGRCMRRACDFLCLSRIFSSAGASFFRGLILAVLLAFALEAPAYAADASGQAEAASEQAGAGGQKAKRVWNVIVVEGGLSDEYRDTLAFTVLGLDQLELIDVDSILVMDGENEEILWRRLSTLHSGRLRFLKDGFYSYGWDSEKRTRTREEIARRLREKKDVDMIIALGSWAGVDMASTAGPDVPVIVMGCSDAQNCGVVKGVVFSGIPNVHATGEPDVLGRMLEYFNSIFPDMKSIGIAFDNSEQGRRLSGVDAILKKAEELKLKVVEVHAPFLSLTSEKNAERLRKCMEELADRNVQGIFFVQTFTPADRLSYVLEPLRGTGIMTFTPRRSDVAEGVLMNVSHADYASLGRFEAGVIKSVIDGTKPGDIPQVFFSRGGLAINLDTAKDACWTPPLEVFLSISMTYVHDGNAVRTIRY